jgi:hypothetical protein
MRFNDFTEVETSHRFQHPQFLNSVRNTPPPLYLTLFAFMTFNAGRRRNPKPPPNGWGNFPKARRKAAVENVLIQWSQKMPRRRENGGRNKLGKFDFLQRPPVTTAGFLYP